MRNLGIYIHIPFCKKKCLYCDFVSFKKNEDIQLQYIIALKKEIHNFKKHNKDIKIKTVYIGGGTPSFLESQYIQDIIKELSLTGCEQEITIEINPGTVNRKKLEDYKLAGINRLSIGLQATQNTLLNEIGRIHTFEDFLETYKIARDVGFKNINVDLMIGLPKQTIDDVKESLEILIKLGVEHISVYSLIVEENTPLQNLIETRCMNLPSEDEERKMYWYAKTFLCSNGYKHYEISNFAKNGYESIHNMDCWKQKEYKGFGIAAHSYINDVRFCNTSEIYNYIKNCNDNFFGKNIEIQEKLDKNSRMNEYMLLGLRMIDGVSIKKFENIFNENPLTIYRENLRKLCDIGLICIVGDNIKLSNHGLDFANLVWEEFV